MMPPLWGEGDGDSDEEVGRDWTAAHADVVQTLT